MSCYYVCLYYNVWMDCRHDYYLFVSTMCWEHICTIVVVQWSIIIITSLVSSGHVSIIGDSLYPLPGEYQPVNSIHNNIDDGDMPSSWSIISPIEVIIITASLCRIADSQCYSDLLKLQIIHFLIGCVIVKLTHCSNSTYCTSIYVHVAITATIHGMKKVHL